jgi:ABC-2 type transport system ATP-binding protein
LTAGTDTVVVRTPQSQQLADVLTRDGVVWEATEDGALRVRIDNPAIVGHLAFQAGVELHELRVDRFDLEQLFFSLTRGEFATAQPIEPNPETGP